MVTQINGLIGSTVGFKFTGEITKDDYDNLILPTLKKATDLYSKINLLMVIDTDLSNFTAAAWLKDAIAGLKNLLNMHRVAVVADSMFVQTITPMASKVVPGEYKAFKLKDEGTAVSWVSGASEDGKP